MRSTAERIVKSCVCQQENYLKLLQFVAPCVGPVGRRIDDWPTTQKARQPGVYAAAGNWSLSRQFTLAQTEEPGMKLFSALEMGAG